ncbi:hypothetical protein NMW59_04330 [Pasteurella multocida]|nr:hypothetical protein [Pasteurella multocida]MDY0676910.1 hypothetical protein [Pasteurella multocida]MDY0681261.1 hypothetical protein [Pasteurella multocida]MDY0709752.1 hypothetical protein [Pasteurella multocida]
MNKIFKVVWNENNQSWETVSELAHGKLKSSRTNRTAMKVFNLSIVAGVAVLGAAQNSFVGTNLIKQDQAYIETDGNRIAIGQHATAGNTAASNLNDELAKGENTSSIAIGNATANRTGSIAIGSGTVASSDYFSATKQKNGPKDNTSAMAIGHEASATNQGMVALGHKATASGSFSQALGAYSVTEGYKATAANNSILVGAESNAATNSMAVGLKANTKGNYSTAGGHFAETDG